MQQLFVQHGIRGVSDYAEVLVADAVGGTREADTTNKGFDIIAEDYGRIEVKCRQLPADGRLEERVQLSDTKEDGFDYLAVVILHPDFTVKGAVLVPYREAWQYVVESAYNRISLSQAASCDGAVDITPSAAAAADRTGSD